jgi:protein ImuA
MRGALHEIAAAAEAHAAAATGFALGLAALGKRKSVLWIAEEMARAESGAPHGAGLDAFGLAPERLVTVSVAHRRDLLWGMEEALRCRAVDAVIGEMRPGKIDGIAVRRLSLAAGESGTLALLLRAAPAGDSSTAATRWIVGSAPSFVIPGREFNERTRNDEEIRPRLAAHLVRNRRGPTGSWILEWSDSDERFILATPAQPVAAPAFDRPHRQVA